MAVQHLPSIRMSSAFHDRSDSRAPNTDYRRHADELSDQSSNWTRSPSLAGKRPAYADEHIQREEQQRFSFHGGVAVLSPTLRKRHRGDSDMSMTDGGAISPLPYGSVRITSTSIRALVHGERGDHREDGTQRHSMTHEDVDFSGRDSWAASSSRGSGRDSDLWERVSSPRISSDQDTAAEEDGARASIGNASRNITFDMLQTHFSRSLKDAANHFGVCTTLLKKICRKNGILSWPYRQIIGLEKSIASMEQQVHYFDGEQRRQYADQLRKLQIKLDAYILTGQAPGEEELAAALRAESTAGQATAQPTLAFHQPLQAEYHHQPQQNYDFPPQSSVMASAVTLDSDEPQQRYNLHAQPSAIPIDQAYDQRYAGTYISPTSQYAPPRALPSLASLLNQPAPPNAFSRSSEPRSNDHTFDHQWRS